MPIANDIAAEIKTEIEPDLTYREEAIRKRLTQKRCQEIVLKVDFIDLIYFFENHRKIFIQFK